MIVITGATGHVGGEAARILVEAGVPVRLVVRDPRRAAHLAGRSGDTEIVLSDYSDTDRLVDALHPGDRVFMVSVYEPHDARLAKHESFVQAALQSDVGHLVYLSFINASEDANFFHAVSHAETEQLIAQSGVPYTFLRTSLYQATVTDLFDEGVSRGPAGEGRASWVSRRDIGAAVAAVLRGGGEVGAVYDLTGPEALTLTESAERVNRLLDTRLSYAHVDDIATLSTKGLPDPATMKEARRSCFTSIAEGEQELVSDDLERLTGIRPAPLDRHVLQYPELFVPRAAAHGTPTRG